MGCAAMNASSLVEPFSQHGAEARLHGGPDRLLLMSRRLPYFEARPPPGGVALIEIVGDERSMKAIEGILAPLSDWSPTICDDTVPRSGILGSNGDTSAGDGETTQLKIRIS